MDSISVMIVEDVPLIAEDIATKLRSNKMIVTGIYESGESALEALRTDVPDLVLMDIQLAGALDGISTAKIISDQYSVPLIYLSDFTDQQTVKRATKTIPFAYLAKPFNEWDLIRAIQVALVNFNATRKTRDIKDHIFVKGDGQSLIKLPYSEIVYIEASRAYCNVVTEGKKYLQAVSMNHVVDQISHSDFVKVHRSYVVNIKKVTGIEGNIVRLGEHSVEMSKSMRDELISRLNIL